MKIAFIESNAKHSTIIRDLVRSAAAEAGHELLTPTEDKKLDEKSAFELFKAALAGVDLVIAEVSELSPHGSLQLGAALQAGKPIISLARSGSDAPASILQSGPYITYEPSEGARDFQARVFQWIEKVSTTAPAQRQNVAAPPAGREHKLFISYSHKDRPYLDRLLVHLRPLERAGRIELWSDMQIRTGDRWKTEIQNALERATIAVLLVSADFMASEFIVNDELPPLLKSAEERGTKILPLIVKPCRFLRDPSLSQFQAANLPTQPYILLSEGEQETVLDQLAAEVERFIGG